MPKRFASVIFQIGIITTTAILSVLLSASGSHAAIFRTKDTGAKPARPAYPTGQPVEPPELKPSGITGSPSKKWESIGPGGGGTITFPSIAPTDPNTVIVTCDMGGVYLTTDGGMTWSLFTNMGNTSMSAFHPRDPNIILLGNTAAVKKSVDGGKTFKSEPSQVRRQSPDCAGHVVLFDPDYPEMAYCSMGGWLSRHGKGGIEYSTNAGSTFTPATGDSVGTFCWSIAVDPASPKSARILIAGTQRGVLRSQDAGKTWKRLPGWNHGECFSVAVLCPTSRKQAVYFAGTHDGAYRSDDRGASWSKIEGVTDTGAACEIACSPYDDKYVYISASPGVWVSSDGGKTFTRKGTNGVRNKGWKEATQGFRHWANRVGSHGGHVGGLGVCAGDPKTAIVSNDMCIFITHDAGENWDSIYSISVDNDKSFAGYGLEVTTSYGAFFKPDDPNWILLCYTDCGMFRSDNYGKSWNHSLWGSAEGMWNSVYQVVFDPDSPDTVWLVQSAKHDLPYKYTPSGKDPYYRGAVSKSTDGGRKWNVTSNGLSQNHPMTSIVLNPDSPPAKRQLFVAAFSDGVYRSDNGGSSWQKMSQGLPRNANVWRLYIGPREKIAGRFVRSVYVTVIRGSGTGLYRSVNLGNTWERVDVSTQFAQPYDIVVDPEDPNRLYLSNDGGANSGFQLSTDRGATWKRIMASRIARGITINPADPNIIAFAGGNVWISENRGETVTPVPDFPRTDKATRATFDPADPNAIWVSTFGIGYFRGPWKDGVTVEPVKSRPAGSSAVTYKSASKTPAPEPLKLNFSQGGKLPKVDSDRATALRAQLKARAIAAVDAGFNGQIEAPVFGRIKTVTVDEADEDFLTLSDPEGEVDLEWADLDKDAFIQIVAAILYDPSPDDIKLIAEYYARTGNRNAFYDELARAKKLSADHEAAVKSLLLSKNNKTEQAEKSGKATDESKR